MSSQEIARYENTYRLEPKKKFRVATVEKIIKTLVEEAMDGLTYDSDKCAKLSQELSEAIKDKVKEQNYDRYKIVTVVTIGEKRSQDVQTILRFLWDVERDRYVYHFDENPHLYILAMCFGIYYE